MYVRKYIHTLDTLHALHTYILTYLHAYMLTCSHTYILACIHAYIHI